jgi:hypothetical protein
MKVSTTNLRNRLTAFHKNEDGMEALQMVLIIAIAAIVLALVVRMWPAIAQWVTDMINSVTGMGTEEAGEVTTG